MTAPSCFLGAGRDPARFLFVIEKAASIPNSKLPIAERVAVGHGPVAMKNVPRHRLSERRTIPPAQAPETTETRLCRYPIAAAVAVIVNFEAVLSQHVNGGGNIRARIERPALGIIGVDHVDQLLRREEASRTPR